MVSTRKSGTQAPFPPCLWEKLLALIALGVLLLVAWWSYTGWLDLKVALKGFSPLDWVDHLLHPGNYVGDFPNGVQNFSKSAFMYLYILIGTMFGWSTEATVNLVVAVELVLYALAVFYLCRVLFPKAGWPFMAVVAAVLIASPARDMSLARYGQPFFIGQFYNAADVFRLLGILALFCNRPYICALLLAAAFVTHPTMALMGAFFALAAVCAQPQKLLSKHYLLAGLTFMTLAACWYGFSLEPSLPAGAPKFPEADWFAYARLNSRHWFPIDMGLFTSLHGERFLPFISFLLLFCLASRHILPTREPTERIIDRQVLMGMAGAFLLVILGVLFSSLNISSTLVKLSLHRANDLIIEFGLVYVLFWIWTLLKNAMDSARAAYRALIGGLVMVALFLAKFPFPVVFPLLLALPDLFTAIRNRDKTTWDWAIIGLSSFICILLTIYAGFHMISAWQGDAYTAWRRWPTLLVWALVLAFGNSLARKRLSRSTGPIVAMGLIIGLSCYWLKKEHDKFKPEVLQAAAYKEAQLWAQAYTAKTALFMVDPTIYYGWRDFSQRSSFGNLREWLYNWCYSSDYRVFREGLNRFSEFQIDPTPYLSSTTPLQASGSLSSRVQAIFYRWTDTRRLEVAKKYGIRYFVLQKNNISQPSHLPVAFQNRFYVILAIPMQ